MYIPTRYVYVIMVCLSWFNVPLLRTNLNIAILSMVNSSQTNTNVSQAETSHICEDVENATHEDDVAFSGPLEWNSLVQGLVLGCYYYGFLITSGIGPWIGNVIGFKKVVGWAMAVSSVLTILSPFAAYHSYQLFATLRVLIGFFQGPIFPASVMGFPVWVPQKDETVILSILMAGYLLGYFITLQTSSVIAQYLNWEAVFFISGSFTLLWSALWFVLIFDTPEHHPRISTRELLYLKKHYRTKHSEKKKKYYIPWFKILTSLPYWAVNLGQLGIDWTRTTVTVLLPAYASQVLNLDLTMVGALSGTPYLVAIVVALVSGKTVDTLKQKTNIPKKNIRKLFSIVGLLGSSTFTLLTYYSGCDKNLIVFYVFLTVAFNQLHVGGVIANNFDLSPTYCGILIGISQGISMSSGFLVPQIAGYVLSQTEILLAWKIIFWLNAGINIFAALFYFIFASADEQPWSHTPVTLDEEVKDNCKELTN